jgi:hypothetical protein
MCHKKSLKCDDFLTKLYARSQSIMNSGENWKKNVNGHFAVYQKFKIVKNRVCREFKRQFVYVSYKRVALHKLCTPHRGKKKKETWT